MAITLDYYPSTNRTIGVFFGVDPSNANTAQASQRALLIGQKLPAGTATAGTAVICGSLREARALAGANSMLAQEFESYRGCDGYGEVWFLPLDDNAAGVAATRTVTFTGTATAAGTLSMYVTGVLIQAAVASGDSPTAIALKLANAINATPFLTVTAASSAGVTTITSRHKGVAAGDITVVLNYRGNLANEATPAGVTVVIAVGVAGSGDPVLDEALANLGERAFDFIASPYSGTGSVASLSARLSDGTGTWGWLNQLFGGAFTAVRGTYAAMTT